MFEVKNVLNMTSLIKVSISFNMSEDTIYQSHKFKQKKDMNRKTLEFKWTMNDERKLNYFYEINQS